MAKGKHNVIGARDGHMFLASNPGELVEVLGS
jgi:hypothetical protein